jgi:hypothetical protein
MPEDALDAGQCPACGFPLDGPVILGTPPARGVGRIFLAALVVLCIAGLAALGAWEFSNPPPEKPPVELAQAPAPESLLPVVHIAPFPHEAAARPAGPDAPPVEPPVPGAKEPPPQPPLPVPVPVEPPKKREGPRPVGVVMKVDPKIAPVRTFDHPDDTAALPDLNSGDQVVLKGRVRALRIGSVNGKASLDASGLVAEEVVITGDLNSDAMVKLNAPGGEVIVRGFVLGNAKLTVAAPGGSVLLTESARMSGGATVTATAKHFEAKGLLSGGAKLHLTLTAGGSLKLARLDEGAVVSYRKSAPGDPPPTVEKGLVRGGARVVAE